MKAIRFAWGKPLLLSLLTTTVVLAQVPAVPGGVKPTSVPATPPAGMGAIRDTAITPSATVTTATSGSATDNGTDTHLDKAVAAFGQGDKTTSSQELQAGITGLETEAQSQSTSFKDKILAQVGKLKALLPLIAGGSLSGGVLQKAVGLAKLASGAGRLEGLLSGGSLLSKAGQLTSGLSGLGSAMSALGGGQSAGQSLISAAVSSVGKLNQGGIVAKAAEPAVKSEISNVLNFVKKAL